METTLNWNAALPTSEITRCNVESITTEQATNRAVPELLDARLYVISGDGIDDRALAVTFNSNRGPVADSVFAKWIKENHISLTDVMLCEFQLQKPAEHLSDFAWVLCNVTKQPSD